MESLLRKENLWDVATNDRPGDNEEEWKARAVNARATIGLLVEDDQLHHIRNANIAKTSWENLEHYYEKPSLSAKTTTFGGNRYILTIIDDYSLYTIVYLLKNKTEILPRFREYIRLVENQSKLKPKIIRSDREGEYVNREFQDFLKKEGIVSQLTAPYSPQQNGKAEVREMPRIRNTIKNCSKRGRYIMPKFYNIIFFTLVETSKCMLLEANLEKKFWREAICTANYLQNRLPTIFSSLCMLLEANLEKKVLARGNLYSKLSAKSTSYNFHKLSAKQTPYELWYGEKSNISHLKSFGSTAYTLIPRVRRRKLDNNSKKVTFVGYESGLKYRLFYRSTKNIVISRNVRFVQNFHEETFIAKFKNQEDIDVGILNKSNSKTKNVLGKETDKTEKKLQMDVEEKAIEVEQPLERRISITTKGKPPICFENINFNRKIEEVEPQTYEDAVQCRGSKQWINAMEEEIESLKEKKTWTLTKLPSNKNVVGSKWDYKIKTEAKGYSQKFDEDFDEVFAP
ncbi:hypothetical protein ILUMI_22540 [Ignelater luminosus]|uniref:Integrase catalytic domain-containing protein n=1 Tax=Ignelater luminosus TaxID=2038154 RepID=A0A8K0G0F8_IGNLU|nr:hypothetical protein ILUMI_22540 [Ignelater luminosus]